MASKVHVLAPDALPAALAAHVRECEAAALARGGRFTVALSGGSMPKVLGQALAAAAFSWAQWHIFYADERCVPLDHADSNHKACQEHFFSKVPIPAAQLHPLRYEAGDERDPAAAVARYTAELAAVFTEAAAPAPALLPQFDLVLLGMGPDGHTASLFPGHLLLGGGAAAAPVPWVAGLTDSPKPPPTRITLTLPVLRAAYNVAFVSGGAAKAPALASILAAGKGADDGDMLPAGRITCAHGPVHWFVDPPAAEQLPPSAL
jgi:6-phosphogluconolactonase